MPPKPWWAHVAGLYDVEADPREQHDLQHALPEVVHRLLQKLLEYNDSAVPTIHRPPDPAGRAHSNLTKCIGPWRGIGPWREVHEGSTMPMG